MSDSDTERGEDLGLKFWDWIAPKNGRVSMKEISCRELMEAAQDYKLREMAFWTCVNLIANAMGRCEVRTFEGGKEVRDRLYYLWNIEPNKNQSSSAFWHELVGRLYQDNEVLIVSDRHEQMVVAEDWNEPEQTAWREKRYEGVTVNGLVLNKTYRESEVLHLKLNHTGMREVIAGLYQSYYRLVQAAMKHYEWQNGQHWKVHVDSVAQNDEEWEKNFANMLQTQAKTFFESNGAILPEFDGYKYENVGGEAADGKGLENISKAFEDIFNWTARGFLIPAVLVGGKVEATGDAEERFLTNCIDPLCDQIQEENNRKQYGFEGWKNGSYVRVDSSSIRHFDLFGNAASVEKLVGSGAFTINDILRAAGQEPIDAPWANEHFLTKNIATMQEAVNALDGQKGGNE